MFNDLPGSDRGRFVAAIVILILGILLILWAWGSWIYRTSSLTTAGMQDIHPPWEGKLL